MKNQKKKCSQVEHQENDAINYCQECNLYMCNKCDSYHSMLFKKHNKYDLDKDINEIFTNYCKEENHLKELKYFCKDHNKLCCVACISKIRDKENGQHKDCNVCEIKDIMNEKKLKLNENIKYLENLSNNLESYIKELKHLYEEMDKKKDELKMKIQKIFTKIRNELNEREDKLFAEIEKIFFKDDIIKKCEKLPEKVKLSLEKGKIKDDDWKDNKLKSYL